MRPEQGPGWHLAPRLRFACERGPADQQARLLEHMATFAVHGRFQFDDEVVLDKIRSVNDLLLAGNDSADRVGRFARRQLQFRRRRLFEGNVEESRLWRRSLQEEDNLGVRQ